MTGLHIRWGMLRRRAPDGVGQGLLKAEIHAEARARRSPAPMLSGFGWYQLVTINLKPGRSARRDVVDRAIVEDYLR